MTSVELAQLASSIAQVMATIVAACALIYGAKQVKLVGSQNELLLQQNEIMLREHQRSVAGQRLDLELKLREFLEEDAVRTARRIVMNEVEDLATAAWWGARTAGDDIVVAAARVCAAYDHVGSFMHFNADAEVGEIFLERWGETALRAHELKLKGFLEWRRAEAIKTYQGFTWFCDWARTRHPTVVAEIEEKKRVFGVG